MDNPRMKELTSAAFSALAQDSSIFEASLHSDKSSRAVVCEAKGTGVKPICHKSGRATMLLSKRSVDSSTAYYVWKMSARWYWRVNQSVSLSAVKEKNGVVLDYNSVLFMVDSAESMSNLLTLIQNLPLGLPSLFLDLEGVSLSRNGSISLITVFVLPRSHIYLVDIHTMQSTAFSTAVGGTTFKHILESPDITKVFFDVRNDSDALFHHFQVKLSGIEDVQLMENAARPGGQRRYLNGLDKCIASYAPLSPEEKARWKAAKEAGLNLFHPRRGGSYEVFNSRPMSTPIGIYCINDVRYLPHLREALWPRLDGVWRQKVGEETKKRILESQSPFYEPQSETKKFGPWGRA
ncbi:hypothetical protein CLIM01_14488 [Colletotrichum limetticola]|uniref:3'-5' exonuclease domain-containing protein n=1 Tax=Colletotrichum limetticola TaxID=1209924 RepID=A0ABQ9P7Q8_9PEZI|nr:hypothetical protein CLIM01_14488 [Colletotrichum limetticola]